MPTRKNYISMVILMESMFCPTMDSSNVKPSSLYRDKKSVEKNYAPNTIPNQGVTFTQKIYNKRKEQRTATWRQQQKLRTELQAKANQAQASTSTASTPHPNIAFYNARVAHRATKFKVYTTVPVNYSPLLNLRINPTLTTEQRFIAYNRHHKCKHGRCYTSYKVHNSIRQDNSIIPVYMSVSCHCDTERIISTVFADSPPAMCRGCSSKTFYTVIDKTSPADICCCLFCKNVYYRIFSTWSNTRPAVTVNVHISAPLPPPPTEKRWNALPTQCDDAKKQFGTEVISQFFKTMLDRVVAVKNAAIDWVRKTITEKVMRMAAEQAWNALALVLEQIYIVVCKRPLTFGYNLCRLMMTESVAERLMLLAIIFEEETLAPLLVKLFNMIKPALLNWLPTPLANAVNAHQSGRTCQNWVRYRSAIADTLHPTTTESESSDETDEEGSDYADAEFRGPEPHPIRHLREGDMSRRQLNDEAKKESGFFDSQFLRVLFGLGNSKSSLILDALRTFNTMTSSWKNLHELVNNFISYLPKWLLKIFTITDPRKRFGVESKTLGNPVYDMCQRYAELLKGDNCASPKAYDEFLIAWRACDRYIATEYPASDVVMRMCRQYKSNASAVMTPGTLGARPIPFVVSFFGPPGTGKSSTWPLLISGIVGGTMAQIRAKSYVRNSTADHYDGYNPEKHKIFVFDDFGAQVDDDGVMELVSIVSNADYLPPFASVDNPDVGVKGTSFNSPIVILCSNFSDYRHCKQVADQVALRRRLGIVIEWDQRFTPEAEYNVYLSTPTGDRVHVLNQYRENTCPKFRYDEIQRYLEESYVKHMRDQKSVSEEFNQYAAKSKCDFLAEYNAAGAVVCDTAKKEGAGFLTCASLLTFTYAMADVITSTQSAMMSAVIGLGVFAVAFGIIYKMFSTTEASKESGQTHTSKIGARPILGRVETAKKELGDQNDDGVIRKIVRNQVVLTNENNNFVSGLFIRGRILLTVKHFIEVSKQLIIRSARSEVPEIYDVDLSECRVQPFANVDLCLIEFPIHVQPFPDVLSRIVDKPLTKSKIPGFTTRTLTNGQQIIYGTELFGGRTMLTFNEDGKTYETISDLRYTFKHQDGDCGNVIFAHNGGSLQIFGMHESGSTKSDDRSYAVHLDRAEICHYLGNFSHESQISREMDMKHEEVKLQVGCTVNKTQLFAMCTQHLVSPAKSDIIPSQLAGVLQDPVTRPAMLKPTNGLNPLANGLKKFGLSTDQFPIEATELAVRALEEELIGLKNDEDLVRDLTLHECLNGIPGLVESVDLSTSSGYPFSLHPQLRGAKRKVISGEPGALQLAPIAQAHYDSWQYRLEQGIVPSDPFIATLKDERRANQKVDAGKTRVFCAGSLTSFMHNKRMFGGFCAFLKRIREKSFSTIGLNRSSQEWHRMIMRFLEVGPHGLDGDQHDWDGRFKAGIAMRLVRLISRWYGYADDSSNYVQMYTLFAHAVFPLIRVTGFLPELMSFVMEVPGCMPSGWFLTLVVNSLVNATLFRIAWVLLVSKPLNDLSYFRRFVREKYCGDDNLLSVADPFLHEFNNVRIQALFAAYGQDYTPASKNGEMQPYQVITDCIFLKNTTGRLFDRYVPLFDEAANLETTNWIRKCDDEDIATESNCNDVLRVQFFRGLKSFEEVRKKILRAKPSYNLVSFQPLASSYLGYGEIPDPYGSFGFTRNAIRDPATLYRAVEKSDPQRLQRSVIYDCAKKESGRINLNMDTQERTEEQEERLHSSNDERALPSDATALHRYLALICRARLQETDCRLYDVRVFREYIQARRKVLINILMQNRPKLERLRRGAGLQPKNKQAQDAFNSYNSIVCAYEREYMMLAEDLIRLPDNPLAREDDSEIFGILIDIASHMFTETDAAVKQSGKSDGLTTEQVVAPGAGTPGATQFTESTLDDSTPKISTNMGVHLAEQQQTVIRKAADGSVKSSMKRAQAHLNETSWDLESMLRRYNLVGAFAWDIGQAPGTEITIVGTAPCDVPTDLLQNDLVSAPFLRFQYWRAQTIKVRFQLVASRFHQGRLLVYYIPSMMPKSALTGAVRGPTRATQLQHAFLDPSNGTVIDMELPFRYHKGWVDLIFGDVLGQLRVQVLNQLQAASGAITNVEVKVFVSFEGAEFRIPRPGGTSFEARVLADAKRLGYTLTKEGEETQKGVLANSRVPKPKRDQAKKQSGMFESAGREVDSLIADIVPAEITGAIAGITLDKPALTEFPEPLAHKDAQYMSASRGVEKLERMALEPSAQYITDDQFGDSVDECDLKYLLKKPVYFTTFTWSATDPVGTVLFSNINSPAHYMAAFPVVSGVPFDPTIIGFFSSLFTYWRGSINLMFQIVGTSFHEGRLDFCNHPGTTTIPTDYPTSVSQYVNSQTIRNTNNTVEISIPFHSDTPWKRVHNGEPLSDTFSDTAVRSLDYVVGSMSVRVAVPLKNPNNVVSAVDVNVFVCAGDDFELHTLSPWGGIYHFTDILRKERKAIRDGWSATEKKEPAWADEQSDSDLEVITVKKDRAKKQSGKESKAKSSKTASKDNDSDLNTDDKTDKGVIKLGVGSVMTYDPPIHHFGESYANLRECAKRYQLAFSRLTTPTVAGDNIKNIQFELFQVGGMISVLANCYRLFRGPMNFKMQVAAQSVAGGNEYDAKVHGFVTTNPQPALFAGAPVTSASAYMSYVGRANNYTQPPMVRFSTTQVAEFQLPFQSIYHSLVNALGDDDDAVYFGNQFTQFELIYNVINPYVTTTKVFNVMVSMALGDETRFGVWYGLPQVARQTVAAYPNPSG